MLVSMGACAIGVTHGISAPTLSEVTARALAAAPELQALDAGVQEHAAMKAQAERWSNPTLSLEKENFAGSRAYRGSALAEYTATLDQTIEVGRKRRLRVELAATALQRAELATEIRRGVVVAEARRRFVAWQVAQAEARIARERLESSRAAVEVVKTKRGAGVAGGLEEVRTQVAVSMAEVELEKTTQQLAQARAHLASLWQGQADEITGEAAGVTLVEPPMDELGLVRRLESGPRWQMTESWQTSQARSAELARAMTLPDVSLQVGHRWFEEGDDRAWIVGVSVPLPIFEHNADGVRAARAGVLRVNAEVAAEQRALRESLAASLARVKTAYASAARLENETLPMARRSFALVEEGYRLGRHELLYLLEAQQTLFAVEAGVAGALGELHFALTDLDALLVSPSGTASEL